MKNLKVSTEINKVATVCFDTYEESDKIDFLGEYFALVINPEKATIKILCFSKNKNIMAFRYSSDMVGKHDFAVYKKNKCEKNNTEMIFKGEIFIEDIETDNTLYKKGGITINNSGRYPVHMDGSPFFWLADTCWMLFSDRLSFPEDYVKILDDRSKKGFTVIMLAAGFYPDMDLFDDRGISGGGFPVEKNLEHFDVMFYDKADKIIELIVDFGMVPCIVGSWGYYADLLGVDLLKKHWEHILARWNSYPVVWCIAGEALMPFYNKNDLVSSKTDKEKYENEMQNLWSSVSQKIQSYDPYGRLITIHPTVFGHEQICKEEEINLNMLQTGHMSFTSLIPALEKVKIANNRTKLPLINAESCYEGICGGNETEIVRFSFWSCILSGCCGHSYGANGIWQCNNIYKPYGPSPHGVSWGDVPWNKALDLPGSFQVGIGAKFLQKYPWWDFEIHPEWVENSFDFNNPEHKGAFCSGIPGKVRIIFKPFVHGFFWGEDYITNIEPGINYNALYFDPISGETIEIGIVVPDEKGKWKSPRVNKFQDWILVLENRF